MNITFALFHVSIEKVDQILTGGESRSEYRTHADKRYISVIYYYKSL